MILRWCVVLGLLLIAGCAPQPIRFERWRLPEVPSDKGVALGARMEIVERELFERCLSPEGLLWYRRPVEPHPRRGAYLDLADQACWSGYLFAGLVFQDRLTGSAEARARVVTVLEGLEFLERVTGVPGLFGRCVAPSEKVGDLAHHPETWWPAAGVPGYSYRSDVSKDQYAGMIFGLAVGAVELEPGSLRDRCRSYLVRCARHVLDGDFRIRDARGEVTRFGDVRGRIFGLPIGVNSSISLALMRAAVRFADDEALRARAAEATESLVGSLTPLHVEFLGIRNYSNALMSGVSMASLFCLETDPKLRAVYQAATLDFLEDFEGEGNAFFVSLGRLGGLQDRTEERRALRNLYTAPTELAIRELPDRFDGLSRRWIPSRKGRPRTREALPLAVRPPTSFRWRSDPYLVDLKLSADGGLQVSGVDLFCAYWFGCATGWIPCAPSGP
ncbi:MAG: hypothetical protein AAF488_10175 [Planctomycetota bacterium]